MNKFSRFTAVLLPASVLCLISILFLILLFDTGDFGSGKQDTRLQTITQWQWEGKELSLPVSLPCTVSRTPVTLTAQIKQRKGDYIYLKTVYAPLRVYADGELIFQYGQDGSFPAFLLDPPTKVALFRLPDTDGDTTLTFEYLSPSQRNQMALHPVLIGSPEAILKHPWSAMGFSLAFAGVLVVLGIFLWLMAFAAARFEKKGIALFWLGLFSLCTGIWVIGECNFTGLLVENANILYIVAFCGLFTMAVPMTKFCLILFGEHQRRLMSIQCLVLETAVCLAVIAQLAGIASLSKTMYLFHILVPLAFCLCGFCILRESIKYHSPVARRFFLPVAVVALFSLLEVANYYVFEWNVQKSFFFQIGVLTSLVMVSVLCGYFIRDTFALKMKNHQLAYEVSLMEKQVEAQKDRYQMLTEMSAALQTQRHDLKHHMAAIRQWVVRGDEEKENLMAYLDQVSAEIPEGFLGNLCENEAVNALAFYYQTVARKAGIPVVIQLNIPADTGQVPASDLCVIIGNFLENGIEACKMADKPFLTLRSRQFNGVLTITMDNSFRSVSKTAEGVFCSSKPGGGTGLISVRSVVEKYGGNCSFEDKDGMFYSSVYLPLPPPKKKLLDGARQVQSLHT
ncbi:GHKL domain-containing protein [Lachnospiraceae bacterium 45-P1]